RCARRRTRSERQPLGNRGVYRTRNGFARVAGDEPRSGSKRRSEARIERGAGLGSAHSVPCALSRSSAGRVLFANGTGRERPVGAERSAAKAETREGTRRVGSGAVHARGNRENSQRGR